MRLTRQVSATDEGLRRMLYYLSSFNQYLQAIREGCVASQIDYTTVDTSLPLDQVLNEFFFRRQTMLNGGKG